MAALPAPTCVSSAGCSTTACMHDVRSAPERCLVSECRSASALLPPGQLLLRLLSGAAAAVPRPPLSPSSIEGSVRHEHDMRSRRSSRTTKDIMNQEDDCSKICTCLSFASTTA